MKKELAQLFALSLMLSAEIASAQTSAFTYQGRLTANGAPVSGSYDFMLAIYDSTNQPGTIMAGPFLQSPIPVTNGLFTLTLDAATAAFSGEDRWLGINVRSNGGPTFATLLPRQRFTSTPYAIRAANFSGPVAATQLTGIILPDNIGPGSITTINLQNECVIGSKIAANQVVRSVNGIPDWVLLAAGPNMTLTPNGNTLTFSGSSDWKLGGNAGTIPGFDILGTTDNSPLIMVTGGFPALRITPGPIANLIGGYNQNSVGTAIGSAIAGGGDVGAANQIQGNYGFIGAGTGNKAGTMAAVPGGQGNVASGAASLAAGYYSTASGDAAVALGFSSSATSLYSMAVGHRAKANHAGSFVWADSADIDFGSTAGDQFSIRAAGGLRLNTDTSVFFDNQLRQMLNLWGTDYGVGVQSSTEYFRSAAGFCWFKGGIHDNSPNSPGIGGTEEMRLSDQGGLHLGGPFGELSLRNRDTFPVYVPSPSNGERWTLYSRNELGSGRLYIWSGSDKAAVDNAGNMYANTFTPTSDRNAKENFSFVDPTVVLDRVAALPITRWNFKQDTGSTHIGPMAQDFYAAFGVGPDDRHIATVDADGVALAAIQGLNQKLESELRQKQTEITALKERLERLEMMITGMGKTAD
jgi:hypothetical protein